MIATFYTRAGHTVVVPGISKLVTRKSRDDGRLVGWEIEYALPDEPGYSPHDNQLWFLACQDIEAITTYTEPDNA